MKANHAVVIGSGIGGMCAARVLSDHFERVTLIERDELPEGAAHRKGVPQSRHPHGLLDRGRRELSVLFPGLEDDLHRRGGHDLDAGLELATLNPEGWAKRRNTGHPMLFASRLLIESVIRDRIKANPRIKMVEQSQVTGLVLEHGDVPEGEYLVPFGEAAVRREGGDVTIVATGWTVGKALAAAEALAADGIQAEVIDPRTIAPLDTATILSSVQKTGRLVIADQSTRHGGASPVIAAEVAEHGFSSLKAPIVHVTAHDVTVPYSEPMEAFVLPDAEKIAGAVRQVLGEAPVAA